MGEQSPRYSRSGTDLDENQPMNAFVGLESDETLHAYYLKKRNECQDNYLLFKY
jgi:hypothetical protein